MPRKATFLLVLLLLFAQVFRAQSPPLTLAAPKDPVAVATGFVDLLLKGDYPAAAALEGGPMKEAAPAAKLGEIWAGIQTQLGAYKRRLGTRGRIREAGPCRRDRGE
jgi:hypothetical protein